MPHPLLFFRLGFALFIAGLFISAGAQAADGLPTPPRPELIPAAEEAEAAIAVGDAAVLKQLARKFPRPGRRPEDLYNPFNVALARVHLIEGDLRTAYNFCAAVQIINGDEHAPAVVEREWLSGEILAQLGEFDKAEACAETLEKLKLPAAASYVRGRIVQARLPTLPREEREALGKELYMYAAKAATWADDPPRGFDPRWLTLLYESSIAESRWLEGSEALQRLSRLRPKNQLIARSALAHILGDGNRSAMIVAIKKISETGTLDAAELARWRARIDEVRTQAPGPYLFKLALSREKDVDGLQVDLLAMACDRWQPKPGDTDFVEAVKSFVSAVANSRSTVRWEQALTAISQQLALDPATRPIFAEPEAIFASRMGDHARAADAVILAARGHRADLAWLTKYRETAARAKDVKNYLGYLAVMHRLDPTSPQIAMEIAYSLYDLETITPDIVAKARELFAQAFAAVPAKLYPTREQWNRYERFSRVGGDKAAFTRDIERILAAMPDNPFVNEQHALRLVGKAIEGDSIPEHETALAAAKKAVALGIKDGELPKLIPKLQQSIGLMQDIQRKQQQAAANKAEIERNNARIAEAKRKLEELHVREMRQAAERRKAEELRREKEAARYHTCPRCSGSGIERGTADDDCGRCDGSGVIKV